MEAHGINGQLYFDGAYVTLARAGLRARSVIGLSEKRIPLSSIGSIQWRPATRLVNGYIQFSTGGDVERRLRHGRKNMDAARDENAVIFRHGALSAFEEIRAAIETAMGAGERPAPAGRSDYDPIARMRTLDEMHEAGMVSDAEYQAKRAQIIDAM